MDNVRRFGTKKSWNSVANVSSLVGRVSSLAPNRSPEDAELSEGLSNNVTQSRLGPPNPEDVEDDVVEDVEREVGHGNDRQSDALAETALQPELATLPGSLGGEMLDLGSIAEGLEEEDGEPYVVCACCRAGH